MRLLEEHPVFILTPSPKSKSKRRKSSSDSEKENQEFNFSLSDSPTQGSSKETIFPKQSGDDEKINVSEFFSQQGF